MIRVLYFGYLRELAEVAEETLLAKPGGESLGAFRARLAANRPALGKALERATIRTAVDDQLVNDDPLLLGNEEIAFMPPVSGG